MQPKALYRRVNGPYKHGQRWRLVIVHGDGREEARSYDTEARAVAARDVLRGSVTTGSRMSVGAALAAYLEERRASWKASSALTNTLVLTATLEAVAGRPLAQLRPADVREALDARGWAVDTRAGALRMLRTFEKWCLETRLLRGAFTEGVKVVGRRKRGKPQLTTDEARRFLRLCLELADTVAGACLNALLLTTGLRVSELLLREVRDVDADGTVLIVWDGKTEHSKRRLRIPAELRAAVAHWAAGKGPRESLFGLTSSQARYRCKELCAQAGVPIVTPHGLRGTNATLRVHLDETPGAIAAALGHGSFGVTAAHYVAPGVAPGAARAEAALLEPPPTARD